MVRETVAQTLIAEQILMTPAQRIHEMRERVLECRRRVRQMRHHHAEEFTRFGSAILNNETQEGMEKDGCTSKRQPS
jgi:hypothetical protein